MRISVRHICVRAVRHICVRGRQKRNPLTPWPTSVACKMFSRAARGSLEPSERQQPTAAVCGRVGQRLEQLPMSLDLADTLSKAASTTHVAGKTKQARRMLQARQSKHDACCRQDKPKHLSHCTQDKARDLFHCKRRSVGIQRLSSLHSSVCSSMLLRLGCVRRHGHTRQCIPGRLLRLCLCVVVLLHCSLVQVFVEGTACVFSRRHSSTRHGTTYALRLVAPVVHGPPPPTHTHNTYTRVHSRR